jgi:hypothetical protein
VGGILLAPHERSAVEAGVEVEVATAAVEAATAPVKVVVEAELSGGDRRQSTQEAHSARAPPGPEPERPMSVPATDDVSTPAPARLSVQGVPGPRVARERVQGPQVAREEAPGPCMAQETVSGPRVAQEKAPGPRVA